MINIFHGTLLLIHNLQSSVFKFFYAHEEFFLCFSSETAARLLISGAKVRQFFSSRKKSVGFNIFVF